jgi:hypothetical protein
MNLKSKYAARALNTVSVHKRSPLLYFVYLQRMIVIFQVGPEATLCESA